jgi:ABC-type Fe3+ transport system permease subunit
VDRKDRFAGLGVLLAALLMATAQTGSKANQVNFGSQGIEREFRNAVEIGNDSGGYVAEYALRLYEMKEARQRVRFVGVCDSACTLFLALPAEQTCITESAYFRFHSPSAPSASAAAAVAAYMMRKYPQWVRVWIAAQGGLSDRLATMSYAYAQNFIRTCNSTQR